MKKKYFGTDGIRGKVGNSTITAEFFVKLGYAASGEEQRRLLRACRSGGAGVPRDRGLAS